MNWHCTIYLKGGREIYIDKYKYVSANGNNISYFDENDERVAVIDSSYIIAQIAKKIK